MIGVCEHCGGLISFGDYVERPWPNVIVHADCQASQSGNADA